MLDAKTTGLPITLASQQGPSLAVLHDGEDVREGGDAGQRGVQQAVRDARPARLAYGLEGGAQAVDAGHVVVRVGREAQRDGVGPGALELDGPGVAVQLRGAPAADEALEQLEGRAVHGDLRGAPEGGRVCL